MRWIRPMIVLLALNGEALFAPPSPKLSTAVFTLDAKRHLLEGSKDNPLGAQLEQWAARCQIEPGGAIAVLTCSGPEDEFEARARLAGTDASKPIPGTLALFRDLDETLYMAGCPLDEEEDGSRDSPQSQDEDHSIKPEDIRDCRDLDAGQTFPTEVENGLLRIVIRGRQLTLKIFEVREKLQTTDTPYVPEPSTSLPEAGPPTRRELKGLESQTEPKWEPPRTPSPAAGKPSEDHSSGADPAHTSLRTGRVMIQCPSRQAVVFIDGVYIGACPVVTSLLAGPHTLTMRQSGREDQTRDIQVEAGKTLRLRIKG